MSPSTRSSKSRCVAFLRGDSQRLFCMWLMLIYIPSAETQTSPATLGDPTCPCLFGDDIPQIAPADLTPSLIKDLGYKSINSTDPGALSVYNYGIDGCGLHDNGTWVCRTPTCFDRSGDPCDRSWCNRSFCYVDPFNCNLTNHRSSYFPRSNRYYSYATCDELDSYSSQNLIAALSGRTLRVGFCSNSGGWTGSYNANGQSFVGKASDWTGPLVNFARLGALRGGFKLEIEAPPDVLYNKSMAYFNTTSKFDYCVFAVSLGYLDFCVGEFTMTDLRVLTSDFLDISTDPYYLVVQVQPKKTVSIFTIFSPFYFRTWLFIVLGVIPALATILLLMEYYHSASVFRTYEEEEEDAVDSTGNDDGNKEKPTVNEEAHFTRDLSASSLQVRRLRYLQAKDHGSWSDISVNDNNRVDSSSLPAALAEDMTRPDLSLDNQEPIQCAVSQDLRRRNITPAPSGKRRIPFPLHLVRSINMSVLSLLQGAFGGTVVTPGGKLTVMAINFFVLVTIAVYTANLAAILTQGAESTSVASFEEALKRNYRFCASRNRIQEVLDVYNLTDDILVKQYPEDGGDGLPGFVDSRGLVFDRLDLTKALAGDVRYCHAALSVEQDLDVMRQQGIHCNKTTIGQPLVYVRTGMPFSQQISRSGIAYYRTMKNQGFLQKEYRVATPRDRCNINQNDDGSSITIAQLSGLWVVTFSLAFVGVLLNLRRCLLAHFRPQRNGQVVEKFGTDQWCNLVEKNEN